MTIDKKILIIASFALALILFCSDKLPVPSGLNTADEVPEVNSIPGLTSHSLLPLSAKVKGIGFDMLIKAMLDSGRRYGEEKAKRIKDFQKAV